MFFFVFQVKNKLRSLCGQILEIEKLFKWKKSRASTREPSEENKRCNRVSL